MNFDISVEDFSSSKQKELSVVVMSQFPANDQKVKDTGSKSLKWKKMPASVASKTYKAPSDENNVLVEKQPDQPLVVVNLATDLPEVLLLYFSMNGSYFEHNYLKRPGIAKKKQHVNKCTQIIFQGFNLAIYLQLSCTTCLNMEDFVLM